MTDRLQTALRETAEACPVTSLAGDPWGNGRRARRRRRLGAAAGVLVATAAIAGGVLVNGGAPVLLPAPADPPGEDSGIAPLPSTLYPMPYGHADIVGDPLGGPASVVYAGSQSRRGIFFERSRSAYYVVGAEHDAVRAVRMQEGTGGVALSPDGTRLALGRSWSGGESERLPPAVMIVDVETGEARGIEFPDLGLGGRVEGLLWMPSGEQFVAEVVVTTSLQEGDGASSAEGEVRSVVVDVATGDWVDRDQDGPAAFSPDGSLEVRFDAERGAVVAEVDAAVVSEIPVREFRSGLSWAFSPDGQRVAGLTWSGSWPETFAAEIFDVSTGDRVGSVELGELHQGALLGWGDRGLVVFTEDADRAEVVRIGVSAARPAPRTHLMDVTESSGGWPSMAIAHDYLDADVRVAEPPPSTISWTLWLEIVGLGVIVALGIGVRRVVRSRRDRGRPVTV